MTDEELSDELVSLLPVSGDEGAVVYDALLNTVIDRLYGGVE